MDVSVFDTRNSKFASLDLHARFAGRSHTCVSFDLCRHLGKRILPANDGENNNFDILPEDAFEAVGRVDVYYPCAGPVKVQLQVWLPMQQHSLIRPREVIAKVFEFLEIPPHENFEWKFIDPDRQTTRE